MTDSKNKKIIIRRITIAMLLVAMVLFYFNYLASRSSGTNNSGNKGELDKLVDYDLEYDYPNTPRDAAKLHCRFMKLFYGKTSLSDSELEDLNKKIRGLYSLSLLNLNTEDVNYANLKADIKEYKDNNLYITNYTLPEASQVKYYEKDDKEYAVLEVKYTMEAQKESGYYYQNYILVKENDHWKIYGWQETEMQSGIDKE